MAACTPSFEDVSEVTDLRVLAIQAEPPEAQYDAQHDVQDVRVRILAVDPLRTAITMLATLCLPTDSRRCESGPVPAFPLLDPARSGGNEFSVEVPGRLLSAAVEKFRAGDALLGLGGVRVMLALSVSDGDPRKDVAADKILLYSKVGTPPNHNPELTGLSLSAGCVQSSLAPGETLKLKRGVECGLRPVLAEGAQEEYDTTDLRGNAVHLKEQPRYFFFALRGAELDRATADEPLDGVAPPEGLTRIEAVSDGPGTMWVVVRDGRGGESWLEIPWEIER